MVSGKGYTDLTEKVGKLNKNKVEHVISIMQNPRSFPEQNRRMKRMVNRVKFWDII